jgi:hypothetical protein
MREQGQTTEAQKRLRLKEEQVVAVNTESKLRTSLKDRNSTIIHLLG